MNCFSRIEYESRNYSWFNLNPNLIVTLPPCLIHNKISNFEFKEIESIVYFKLVIKRYATTIITKLILIFGNQLMFFPITAIYNWK
jgi:hypothetical protein